MNNFRCCFLKIFNFKFFNSTFYKFIKRCMNRDEPNKRPTATQLLDLINNYVQKEVNIFK